MKLGLFRRVKADLERQEGLKLPREVVVETIAMAMPAEDYETMFERFTQWARFGDLFDYDEATETLSMPPPEHPA
jgi:hypothetical protein